VVSFYRKFIKDFTTLMTPLNEVAKKWYKDGWGKGEGYPRITHTKINYWGKKF